MGIEVFWIRLFCAEFDDPRWLAIEQMPDADAVQIIYVRMLTLAGRSNANGLLLLHENLPYDFTTLSAVLRRSVPVVQFALATLEKFKFIEMVDNVIAITAWDQLQPTGELAKIADRREKDKIRKREERDEKKKLLLASVDMSEDSPRTSRTTKKELKTDKSTTATSFKTKDGVAVNDNLAEVLALVPQKEINSRLRAVISDAIKEHGKDIAMSNVRYALRHHNHQKGKLGGMICAAVMQDFACQDREVAVAEQEAQAAARIRREKNMLSRKEQEERECREALAQQAAWLALTQEERSELAYQARKKLPCLPEPVDQIETGLDNMVAPVSKIFAAMYANGELVLPVGSR